MVQRHVGGFGREDAKDRLDCADRLGKANRDAIALADAIAGKLLPNRLHIAVQLPVADGAPASA